MDIDKALGISQFVACINYSDLTTTVHIQEMKSKTSSSENSAFQILDTFDELK